MLDKKEFEAKIKEVRAQLRKVDPTVPFSDAKIKAEKERIAKEKGETINDPVAINNTGTGGKKPTSIERPVITKPISNEARKVITGALVGSVNDALEKKKARDKVILSRIKKVGDPTHYHISDDEPLI